MDNQIRVHLVGGFLGSGKTTAIIGAARHLLNKGMKVGVVTNDQGRYLVDTAFYRLAGVPAVEVTDGCFCCNYGELESKLDQLAASAKPDVVFAESVGSCADLAATVLKPMQKRAGLRLQPASLSVFTDVRLLKWRLQGAPMPFGSDIVYVYDKQIEEAGALVINKADLVGDGILQEVLSLARQRFPGKAILTQDSHNELDVTRWVDVIEWDSATMSGDSLDLDYARYGRGEAQLAWLDETISLKTQPGQGRATSLAVLAGIVHAIRLQGWAIGHLKFMLQAGDVEAKVSFTSLDQPGWETDVPLMSSSDVTILVNARIECAAESLRQLVSEAAQRAAAAYGAQCLESRIAAFHPKQPSPTYRIT